MSNEEIVTHEEVKKRHELMSKGFGQAVKGFRTMGDAADFNNRWRNVEPKMIRLMYPKRTQGMNIYAVEHVKQEVFEATKKAGL